LILGMGKICLDLREFFLTALRLREEATDFGLKFDQEERSSSVALLQSRRNYFVSPSEAASRATLATPSMAFSK
jgi:hypothetical protein